MKPLPWFLRYWQEMACLFLIVVATGWFVWLIVLWYAGPRWIVPFPLALAAFGSACAGVGYFLSRWL